MLSWTSSVPCPKFLGARWNTLRLSLNSDHVLCIDLGTSSTKVARVRLSDGHVGEVGYGGHSTVVRPGGLVEQRLEEWLDSVRTALKGQEKGIREGVNVVGLAVTGQMQDLIEVGGLESKKKLLGDRVVLYSDGRGLDLGEGWGGSTGIMGKLLWWKEEFRKLSKSRAREIEVQAPEFLFGAADFLVYLLCGKRVCDATTLSTTGIAKAGGRCYRVKDMIGAGYPREWISGLPEIMQKPKVCGKVSKEGADKLGLSWLRGLPVIHAGGDAATATIGAGCGEATGKQHVYLGTSGWIGGSFTETVKDDVAHSSPMEGDAVFNLGHPLPGFCIRLASMASAGGCLSWGQKVLYNSSFTFDQINAMVRVAPVGCSGVLFLPHILGERCPFVDADARGALVGLSGACTPSIIFRAIMEGVAFNYRACRDKLVEQGLYHPSQPEQAMPVIGGGTQSSQWVQILADVLNRPLEISPAASVGGLRGAAAVASLALGRSDSINPDQWFCDLSHYPCRTVHPKSTNAEKYSQLFSTWGRLYPALRESFREIAQINT